MKYTNIVPKCLGGNNKKENLIKLTAKEHFIAHLLLLKIYPQNYNLIKALNIMCVSNKSMVRNNRMYGWLKEKFSREMSRSQKGEKNSQFHTCWISHLDFKVSFKISKNYLYEYILEGFVKKRILNFSTYNNCIICGKINNNTSKTCSLKCNVLNKKNKGIYVNYFKDKKHNEKTISLMKGHKRNCKEKNPMFGYRYMFNDNFKISKRINPMEILNYQLNGWKLGKKNYS